MILDLERAKALTGMSEKELLDNLYNLLLGTQAIQEQGIVEAKTAEQVKEAVEASLHWLLDALQYYDETPSQPPRVRVEGFPPAPGSREFFVNAENDAATVAFTLIRDIKVTLKATAESSADFH